MSHRPITANWFSPSILIYQNTRFSYPPQDKAKWHFQFTRGRLGMNAINKVHWHALLEHKVLRCLMDARKIVQQRLPGYHRKLWNGDPHLVEIVGSRGVGRDSAEDVHAAVWCDASVVKEQRCLKSRFAESHPSTRFKRQLPNVVERTTLIVSAGNKKANLLIIVYVFRRMLHQWMTLSGLWIALIGIGICRDFAPLSLNEIIHGQRFQVKDSVSRASSQYVNVSIVDGDFMSIPSHRMIRIDFRSTQREQLPFLWWEVESAGCEASE